MIQPNVRCLAALKVLRALPWLAMVVAFAGTAAGQDAADSGGRGAANRQSESSTKPSWEAFADCAAGYQANIKSRESDPSRTPSMRNMIQEQADDYQRAAVRAYMQARNTGEAAATRAVNARIGTAVDRFVAMDKAGELDRFLEECPQPDEAGQG